MSGDITYENPEELDCCLFLIKDSLLYEMNKLWSEVFSAAVTWNPLGLGEGRERVVLYYINLCETVGSLLLWTETWK